MREHKDMDQAATTLQRVLRGRAVQQEAHAAMRSQAATLKVQRNADTSCRACQWLPHCQRSTLLLCCTLLVCICHKQVFLQLDCEGTFNSHDCMVYGGTRSSRLFEGKKYEASRYRNGMQSWSACGSQTRSQLVILD